MHINSVKSVVVVDAAALSQIPLLPKVVSDLALDVRTTNQHQDARLILTQTDAGRLILRDPIGRKRPFFVRFVASDQKHAGNKLLAASKLRHNPNWCVLDTTAGLGQDGFLLAQFCSAITLVEQNPLVHLLLQDALHWAQQDPITAQVAQKITLVAGDAQDFLLHLPAKTNLNTSAIVLTNNSTFEVIYLDPMFQGKKALAKRSMQLLRDLCHVAHNNNDQKDDLFQLALANATRKVIVKRGQSEPWLGDKKPTSQYVGKTHRFDVYACG